MPQEIMTYGEFLKGMKENRVMTAFKGTRTMLSVEKLNDCQAVIQMTFFEKEGEPKEERTRMAAVMIWEEAWHTYETFESND